MRFIGSIGHVLTGVSALRESLSDTHATRTGAIGHGLTGVQHAGHLIDTPPPPTETGSIAHTLMSVKHSGTLGLRHGAARTGTITATRWTVRHSGALTDTRGVAPLLPASQTISFGARTLKGHGGSPLGYTGTKTLGFDHAGELGGDPDGRDGRALEDDRQPQGGDARSPDALRGTPDGGAAPAYAGPYTLTVGTRDASDTFSQDGDGHHRGFPGRRWRSCWPWWAMASFQADRTEPRSCSAPVRSCSAQRNVFSRCTWASPGVTLQHADPSRCGADREPITDHFAWTVKRAAPVGAWTGSYADAGSFTLTNCGASYAKATAGILDDAESG